MTTVVAAAVDGVIVMAADTLTNVYDRPIVGAAKKIRRVPVGEGGEALLAFCGSGGLTAAADEVKLVDSPGGGDMQRWATTVAHAMQDWAAAVGLIEGGRLDGSILLGFRGRLWTLSEIQAIPHPDGRAALGSGEGPAIGALDALLNHTDLELTEAVTRAASIGITRDRYSGEPIQVELLAASPAAERTT